jgi:hypothetical protein
MQSGIIENDKYLNPQGSPMYQGTINPKVVPWEFSAQQGIQGKKVRASTGQFNNLKALTVGTLTLGGQNNINGRLIMENSAGGTTLILDNGGIAGTQAGNVTYSGTQTISGQQNINGTQSIGGQQSISGTSIVSGAFAQRHYITVIEAGASGGAPTSFFTNSSTPQGLDTSRVSLNPDNFPSNKFYIEAVYRCGTTGEPARTIYVDFYDVTGGTVIANGTFSGTSQSGTGYGIYPRERSLIDFRPSMISGNRDYMLRYWGTSSAGTLFVDLYAARLIIDF